MPSPEDGSYLPLTADQSGEMTEEQLLNLHDVLVMRSGLLSGDFYKTLQKIIEERGPAIRDSIQQSGPNREKELTPLLNLISKVHPTDVSY